MNFYLANGLGLVARGVDISKKKSFSKQNSGTLMIMTRKIMCGALSIFEVLK